MTQATSTPQELRAKAAPHILVRPDGPYIVSGEVPLVRKRPVEDAEGNPIGWETIETVDVTDHIEEDGTVHLCRCGHSTEKPYCTSTHKEIGFDGTEAAPTASYDELAKVREHDDRVLGDALKLCSHAGFCSRKTGDVWHLLQRDLDADGERDFDEMVDLCPSGRLARRRSDDEQWTEPDLPVEIVLVADGQLFVTGGIPVERSDGEPIETRNRVSLCRCGESQDKPLCDGSHSEVGFTDEA